MWMLGPHRSAVRMDRPLGAHWLQHQIKKKDPVSSIPPRLAQFEPNKLSFPTWNFLA